MAYKVGQMEPYLGEEEIANLKKVIQTGWLTEGPFAAEFLEKVKKFTGARHALLVNNGTLALYLALIALDIKAGDEVLVPDFTFSASASSVVFMGATPRFVDVSDVDLNIDVSKIEEAVTEKTRAIVPVHLYGRSADMDPILEIARKHSLKVIEDAAQGFGVFYKGRHAGTMGDAGTFSFFADKTLTTGEGGMIVTNNGELYEKLKLLRNQGRPNSGTFVHPSLGMNFRMSDLQCAVGCAQMDKFGEMTEKKLDHARLYQSLLREVKEVSFVGGFDYTNWVPFRANVLLPMLSDLIPYLEEKGIQTRQFYYPLHRQPYLARLNYDSDAFPVSNKAFREGLSLPVFCNLKKEQIEYVCETIRSFYKG